MAPPKKLPYAERMQRQKTRRLRLSDADDARLRGIMRDLRSFYRALVAADNADAADTWRWAALHHFRTLQSEFPQENAAVSRTMEIALFVAQEAQQVRDLGIV